MKPFALLLSVCLLTACANPAGSAEPVWPENLKSQIGQTYELRWTQSTESSGGDSSGTSSSRDSLLERVIDVRPEALILEFDLPAGTSDIDRRRAWQYPARIELSPDNKMTLLNPEDLKRRNDDWLAWGNYDQRHCGLWIFTWTAQKIECDPESVLGALETFNIRRAVIREGAPYTDFGSLKPEPLRSGAENGLSTLQTSLALDPEIVREERIESAKIVAQITGQDEDSLAEELAGIKNNQISGAIEISYTLDNMGEPVSRDKTTMATITTSDGRVEKLKTIESVTRTLID